MATEDVKAIQTKLNMRMTENGSYTFDTTESKCIDFYFDVMQHTDLSTLIKRLSDSWEEDALLTLKLVFQLRDIRHGKGAFNEFHHCLLWLFDHHPQTLIFNLHSIPQQGYWKDLSYLVKFILTRDISKTTKKQLKSSAQELPINQDEPVEEIIRRRVSGQISNKAWDLYLTQLPSDQARKEFKLKFQSLANQIHKEMKSQAKVARKRAKAGAETRLEHAMSSLPNFAQLYNTVVNLFASALKSDKQFLLREGYLPASALAGKWSPTIDCSIDTATRLGKNIAIALFPEGDPYEEGDSCEEGGVPCIQYPMRAYWRYNKDYLAPLRKCIDVPERLMSQNMWSKINYDRVPSVSMQRNKSAFKKRDSERFSNYLDQVKKGMKKIASGALMPHEIIGQLNLQRIAEFELVAELQWNSYVDRLRQSGLFASALAVCDVSGSMTGVPMEAAIALSLLTAELSQPPFKNYICTFSSSPQLHVIDQPTLKEKAAFVRQMDWGGSTNLRAVFELILELARTTQLPPGDMVKTIFIFSDMEFDECGGTEYETDYQLIRRLFDEAGYQLPAIVFWNLRGGNRSKPVDVNERNVALVSGFSGQMMKTFLEKGSFSSPLDTMLDTLGDRYDHLQIID